MPQFRWPEVANDISLARKVVGRRPSKLADWEVIADKFSRWEDSVKNKDRCVFVIRAGRFTAIAV